MTFWSFLRDRRWPTAFGYLLFIGMMAAGYFYNVTFIQLGLTDLCRRILGMSEQRTAHSMALLALLSLLIALLFGYWMMKTGRSAQFLLKLRITFAVVAGQTLLTLLVTQVTTQAALFLWISFASLALGVGMPATFSLTVDLIPRRDRGMVAGLSLAVLMAYTILLIPVSMLLLVFMLLAATFGAVPAAVGVGKWTMRHFQSSPPATTTAAVIGMLLLALMAELLRHLPWIGNLLVIALLLTAFGGVLQTRFGVQRVS